jgi:hypothetical protein
MWLIKYITALLQSSPLKRVPRHVGDEVIAAVIIVIRSLLRTLCPTSQVIHFLLRVASNLIKQGVSWFLRKKIFEQAKPLYLICSIIVFVRYGSQSSIKSVRLR